MKKNSRLLTIIFVFFYFTGFSQLKVASDGKVGVGIGTGVPNSKLTIGAEGDSIYSLFVKGNSYGLYSEGNIRGLYALRNGDPGGSWLIGAACFAPVVSSRYTFGAQGVSYNADGQSGRAWGVFGRAGNAVSGYNYGVQGTIKGSNNGAGILGTTNDNLDVYISGMYAGYFLGNMKVTGTIFYGNLTQSSDMQLKQNVVGLETSIPVVKGVNTLNTVLQMAPVEYNLKQQYQESKGDSATVKKALYDEDSQLFQKKHFGLIAQDLQKIYPELVYEGDDGYLGVDYIGIVPLLIQSIKDLKAEVDGLKSANIATEKSAQEGVSISPGEVSTAVLYQNTPNPFDSQTTIRFEIPESVQNAQLHLCNMTGTLLKTLQINQRGVGDVIINGNEFNPGMYLYSLVCDGRIVDTKQMLLTK